MHLAMASPGILENPVETPLEQRDGGWLVTVFDNDTNTIEEVMLILMIATQCSQEEASIETWEIHHLGKSVVHHAGEAECRRVAEVIGTIGIEVTVTKDD